MRVEQNSNICRAAFLQNIRSRKHVFEETKPGSSQSQKWKNDCWCREEGAWLSMLMTEECGRLSGLSVSSLRICLQQVVGCSHREVKRRWQTGRKKKTSSSTPVLLSNKLTDWWEKGNFNHLLWSHKHTHINKDSRVLLRLPFQFQIQNFNISLFLIEHVCI